MKVGVRKPSIKKSIKARTTGKAKRAVKKAVIPGYGKKGMGYIHNPKKAVYNKVYNKVTVDARPASLVTNSLSSKKSNNYKGTKDMHTQHTNNSIQILTVKPTPKEMVATILFGFLGAHKFLNKEYLKGIFYLLTCGCFGILWIYDIYKICKLYFKSKKQDNFNTTEILSNEDDTIIEKELNTIKYLNSDELSKIYHDRKTYLFKKDYVVFDVETTGLDTSHDKIIEISAIKYINNQKVDSFSQLINPNYKLNPTIIRITGITDDDLVNKPEAKDIIPEFIKFIGNYQLIAHNASFDLKMLISECYRNNIEFPNNKVLDTLSLSKNYFSNKEIKNYKLETFKTYFNLDVNSHRALDDCYTCAILYQYCYEKYQQNRPELNNDEIKVMSIIDEILKTNNKETYMIRGLLLTSNILSVSAFYSFFKIKCRGKIKYILIPNSIDMDKYDFSNFEITESKKNDNAQCRLLFNSIDDIKYLSQMIIDEYDDAIKSKNNYIQNSTKGKLEFEKYLNIGYFIE